MTFTAGHLTAAYWMMKGPLKLCPHRQMATLATVGLSHCRCQHGILPGVRHVAVSAGQTVRIVSAAVPARSHVLLMTGEADAILLRQREWLILAEVQNRRPRLSRPQTLGVVRARPMAALALELGERSIGIFPDRVWRSEELQNVR